MIEVYIDECGHTGPDLLRSDQPVFALSAVVPCDGALDNVRQCFQRFQGSELKHVVLHRGGRHDKELIEAQRYLLERCNGISYVMSKRHLLIESFIYDCVAPANPLFLSGTPDSSLLARMLYWHPELFGGEEFKRVLTVYQDAARFPNENMGYFLSAVEDVKNENLAWLVSAVRKRHPRVISAFAHDPALQLQVACLTGLITQLELQLQEPFKIVYDSSAAIDEAESEILKFASSDCGPTQVADGVTVDFPLRHFKGLESADSRVEEDLQLSDILAGGAVCAAKSLFAPTGDNEYGRRVMDLYNEFPIDRWLFRPCAVMSDFSGEISWILAHIRK